MFSDNCLCVLLQWTLKVRLRRICAVSCRSLLGDIVSLAPLKELESLDLRYCSSVGGDVGGLVQLSHKLKEIMLDNTVISQLNYLKPRSGSKDMSRFLPCVAPLDCDWVSGLIQRSSKVRASREFAT